LGLRIRVRDPGPKYVGPVSPFFDLLRPDRCRYDLGPRYVALGFCHRWSFTYWSVVFGGAPSLVPREEGNERCAAHDRQIVN